MMTRQDWRDLVFWLSASGAFLTTVLLCYVISAYVVRVIEMLV